MFVSSESESGSESEKERKAVVMRVARVPLPLEYQVTVNQKKVQKRKHLELLRKGRRTFVWFEFFDSSC